MGEWLGLPVAASAEAAGIDQSLVAVHALMLVLFVGWSAFFVYTLVRFRHRANRAVEPTRIRRRWAAAVEVGILVVEVVLIVALSLPVWSARVNALPVPPNVVTLRVVAEQFAWNVHYPGTDGQFGATRIALIDPDNPLGLDRNDPAARDDVTTVNELHLPVDVPAVIYLTSKDVIHSFTLPQMRVKQDTMPGSMQVTWFTPTRTGQWEIVCSQLCGLAHYRMRGFYTVEPDADFRAWLAANTR